MFPGHFIVPERIRCDSTASSKKRALEEVGMLLLQQSEAEEAVPGIEAGAVFDKLLERERLGSTGLGHGIALPHARMTGLKNARGAFIRLEDGIDFDAIDNQPVNLIFALLVPEAATEEHLKLLATLAGLFSQDNVCQSLRDSTVPEQAMQIISRAQALAETA